MSPRDPWGKAWDYRFRRYDFRAPGQSLGFFLCIVRTVLAPPLKKKGKKSTRKKIKKPDPEDEDEEDDDEDDED